METLIAKWSLNRNSSEVVQVIEWCIARKIWDMNAYHEFKDSLTSIPLRTATWTLNKISWVPCMSRGRCTNHSEARAFSVREESVPHP